MFQVHKKQKREMIQHTIRFDEYLHERLKDFAKKENISFNQLVLECCQYALENFKGTK